MLQILTHKVTHNKVDRHCIRDCKMKCCQFVFYALHDCGWWALASSITAVKTDFWAFIFCENVRAKPKEPNNDHKKYSITNYELGRQQTMVSRMFTEFQWECKSAAITR